MLHVLEEKHADLVPTLHRSNTYCKNWIQILIAKHKYLSTQILGPSVLAAVSQKVNHMQNTRPHKPTIMLNELNICHTVC